MARDESKKLVKKSRAWAREKAKTLKKYLGKDKKKLAKYLYEKPAIEYGIDECIESGNFGPFPHEIKKTAECMHFALIQYFLADALDLDPKIHFCWGLEDAKDNLKTRFGSFNHAFIDVDTGRKKRVIVDRQMGMFGFVDYNKFEGTIKIRDNITTKNTKRSFSRLEEQSLNQIVDRMMYSRTPEGALAMLEGGQRTKSAKSFSGTSDSIWLKYVADEKDLVVHAHIENSLESRRGIFMHHLFDEQGEIERRELEFMVYKEHAWTSYKGDFSLARYDIQVLQPVFDAFDEIFKGKDKNKTRLQRKSSMVLKQYLKEQGMSLDDSKSLTKSPNLEKALIELEPLFQEQFQKLTQHPCFEVMESALLTYILYEKSREDLIRNGKDNEGYIFPIEERDQILLGKAKTVSENSKTYFEREMDHMLGVAKVKKSKFGMVRMKNELNQLLDVPRMEASDMIAHRLYQPQSYHRTNDQRLFADKIMSKKSIEEKRSAAAELGTSSYDAFKGYMGRFLIESWQAMRLFNEKQFIPKTLKLVGEGIKLQAPSPKYQSTSLTQEAPSIALHS